MTTKHIQVHAATKDNTVFAGLDRETMALMAAIVLGIGLVAVIGFAGGDMLHNAAHDLRHASGFPCH